MILILILFIIIDIYAFQAVRTVFDSAPLTKNPAVIVYWAISLVVYVLVALGVTRYFNLNPSVQRVIMGAVICIGVAKLFIVSLLLVDDVTRFLKWIPTNFYSGSDGKVAKYSISRSEFLNRMALMGGGALFGLFTWGMIRTAYQYKVMREKLSFDKLPDTFQGMKIVQISDMHLGSFLTTEPVQKAVAKINELDADIVLFTGDMVNSIAAEAEPFIEALSKINAKYGVYSVLGNHDYGSYYRWGAKEETVRNLDRLKAIHGECGWKLLNNANEILNIDGARIAVIGVENWGHSEHFPKYGNLQQAMAGTGDADLKLLLSHDPSHWDYKVSRENPDIDITFSGHTHGFQMGIEIPWLKIKWSPSKYVYKQWAGLYKRKQQFLYVNRGLGFIGYHGRVGIHPEITLLEVTKA
ncbi:MAG: metallophosphoesterase [Bacteroidetes bacterium]|nr:metallophosphoesterase [Bacteroidota bacterium]